MAAQFDTVGPFTIYSPAGAETNIGWLISLGSEFLPGTYDNRDAALLAIGLACAGDPTLQLSRLRRHVSTVNGHRITVEDIINYSAIKAETS
ncbi:hypothetical protein F4556_004987 [Kitasatospora gansuensis]|uniref:Uncharacterized protein n=1 Tax=Kitasatospora gansuensis TaxID=258050 RepID=A0A7W7WJ40_9ACTN|nr:hypothetical protein [Kitasatospora gansuensis]MBB4949452.1 hypothetical protein [Kitasatospora gansuensis]